MHQTNKLKTEACLEVLREAGGEFRIFMLDILHVAYWEGISQEICSLFVKMIHNNHKTKELFFVSQTASDWCNTFCHEFRFCVISSFIGL